MARGTPPAYLLVPQTAKSPRRAVTADYSPTTLLAVRTVKTCGASFALLEDDIVAVLTLIGDDDTALDRAAVLDLVSDLVLPVVSLGEQLFPTRVANENKVVVLRQDDDVFGLLVES